ncbi:uncharacterized protein CC84DRAFT_202346 [Paraphaeosphaeria sporulosa]|uniref:Arrestin-like N-terminal domain-containing protein n=1 Tax=Paraphaeosphaeria sporulosa TaxID=1460663 RepID=A0A177C475_9PLEO|nr:uncharacterized protein CC84DRAFT_202346 [Paraphaeosphaeria sporulosa]OAG01598.1 hypothetical protein CC84DRAFT_202346 [Paraphaeosphaeria sporulosa]
MSVSIPRKQLRLEQIEEMELLSTFPRPPPGPRSPARLSLQSPGLTPRPSNYGFVPTTTAKGDTDANSLYDEPEPLPPPSAQPAQDILPSLPTPSKHDPELQIVLDHPSRVYAPGETITGYIIGWSIAEEHVRIILSGQITTTLQAPKAIYTNHTPLVLQTKDLDRDLQSSMPRFELSILHVCDLPHDLNDLTQAHELRHKYWTTKWPAQNPFENDAGHPLPPSMYMGPRSASRLSNAYGSVSTAYTLIAVRSIRDRSTNALVTNAHFQLPITLTTRRLPISKINLLEGEKHHMTSNLSIQTAALTKERKLRLREQLCDAFNTSAPTFYFSIKGIAPRLSVPGANIKISVTVEVLAPPPGKLYNFPIPDITVASMKFLVRSYTGIRTFGSESVQTTSAVNASGIPCRKETFKETAFAQTQTPTNATFIPQKGRFDGQVCIATIALPKEVLPSFKTYSAWRGYRLECALRLKVAGKDAEAKFATDLDVVAGGGTNFERTRVPTDEGMSRQTVDTIVGAYMVR